MTTEKILAIASDDRTMPLVFIGLVCAYAAWESMHANQNPHVEPIGSTWLSQSGILTSSQGTPNG